MPTGRMLWPEKVRRSELHGGKLPASRVGCRAAGFRRGCMRETLMLWALLFRFSSSIVAAEIPDAPGQDDASKNVSARVQDKTTLPRVRSAPLTGGQKFYFYLKTTYGPGAVAFSLFGSGVNQARDAVPEWGEGTEGYGRRLGSLLAQKAVGRSIRLGMGALMHEDPRYFASNRSGIANRTLYAAGQVFVAHKDWGGTRFSYSRFVGEFSAAVISRQWYPQRFHHMADYLSAGATSIGIGMAKNLFFEFWPDIKRKLR